MDFIGNDILISSFIYYSDLKLNQTKPKTPLKCDFTAELKICPVYVKINQTHTPPDKKHV